jgi:ketosteroid isomerase-like protein
MIWVRICVLSLLGLVVLGASPPSPSGDALRTEVQGVVKAYVDAQNKVDANAIMEMVSKNPGVASISLGHITRGWEAIRSEVDETVGSGGQMILALGTIDVTQLGANFALAFAPCTLTLASGIGSVQLHGALTVVLEKSGGKWKVFHEHASVQLPSDEGQ